MSGHEPPTAATEAGSSTTVAFATPTRLGDSERAAISTAITSVLDSTQWVLGEHVEDFETQFAAACGLDAAVGVASGTDALTIAFAALAPSGGSVLVPESDGGYAAVAARLAGLEPVAVDVTLQTGAPDLDALARAVRPDSVGLVATHLHGDALDLTDLDEWRTARGLWLVEDCAQAFGAARGGTPVGATGDLATFSFYPTKPLGTVGDGGAVAARGARALDVLSRVRELREYGWTSERFRLDLPGGRNSRLDALHAAVLVARLPFAAPAAVRRRSIRQRYALALAATGRAVILGADDTGSAAHHAVVFAQSAAERDDLRATLSAAEIGTSVHYPWLVSEMAGLDAPAADGGSPGAAERRARILSLPCDAAHRDDEIDTVVQALERWAHAPA